MIDDILAELEADTSLDVGKQFAAITARYFESTRNGSGQVSTPLSAEQLERRFAEDFPAVGRPVGVDHREGPRENRVRGGQARREARLDDAVAPRHLPRPAGLPCPQARVRRVHAGQAVPVLRRRTDRSGGGR